jgi:Tfp pilus assembly protein PilE
MQARLNGGFTLVELMVAALLASLVLGASLMLIDASQRAFQAQADVPDVQQRLRASIDMMTAGVRSAGGIDAPIRPYRVGTVRDDASSGVFYRSDAVTTMSGTESVTYWLRADGAGTFDLMQYDGRASDLPVVDHVVHLSIEYFADDGVRLDAGVLQDGPWLHDVSGRLFDADLMRIRSIGARVVLRSVLGPRFIPDVEIRFGAARRTT